MSRCDLSKVTQLVGGRAGLIMPTTLVVPGRKEHGGEGSLCTGSFRKGEGCAGAAAGSTPKNHSRSPPTSGPTLSPVALSHPLSQASFSTSQAVGP